MACNTVVVVSPGRGRSSAEEPVDIFGRDLGPDRRAQVVEAVGCQVVVEVAVTRRERQHLDARTGRKFGLGRGGLRAHCVDIAGDIEAAHGR